MATTAAESRLPPYPPLDACDSPPRVLLALTTDGGFPLSFFLSLFSRSPPLPLVVLAPIPFAATAGSAPLARVLVVRGTLPDTGKLVAAFLWGGGTGGAPMDASVAGASAEPKGDRRRRLVSLGGGRGGATKGDPNGAAFTVVAPVFPGILMPLATTFWEWGMVTEMSTPFPPPWLTSSNVPVQALVMTAAGALGAERSGGAHFAE